MSGRLTTELEGQSQNARSRDLSDVVGPATDYAMTMQRLCNYNNINRFGSV